MVFSAYLNKYYASRFEAERAEARAHAEIKAAAAGLDLDHLSLYGGGYLERQALRAAARREAAARVRARRDEGEVAIGIGLLALGILAAACSDD